MIENNAKLNRKTLLDMDGYKDKLDMTGLKIDIISTKLN